MEELEIVMNFLDNLDVEESEDLFDLCVDFGEGLEKEWQIRDGASRICFYRTDSNYVYKVDRYVNNQVYCAIEAYNYQKAKEYKVERVCLAIEFVGITDNGIKVYRQEKFDTDYHNSPAALRKEWENAIPKSNRTQRKIADCLDYRLADGWRRRCTQLYGKRFMRSLGEWMKDCSINDLHRGNVGVKNNRPIILDYAGFHGEDYSPSDFILENF